MFLGVYSFKLAEDILPNVQNVASVTVPDVFGDKVIKALLPQVGSLAYVPKDTVGQLLFANGAVQQPIIIAIDTEADRPHMHWEGVSLNNPEAEKLDIVSDAGAFLTLKDTVSVASKDESFLTLSDKAQLTAKQKASLVLADKADLINNVTALSTVMAQYLDTVIGGQTFGPPAVHTWSPATIAQLQQVKAMFEQLLGGSVGSAPTAPEQQSNDGAEASSAQPTDSGSIPEQQSADTPSPQADAAFAPVNQLAPLIYAVYQQMSISPMDMSTSANLIADAVVTYLKTCVVNSTGANAAGPVASVGQILAL